MNDDYQRMAVNAISHEAFCAGQAWQQAAAAYERPCVLWKPRLFIDGNQWCALFGENIQEGVVGFGDSPDEAMWAFDAAWRKKLSPLPGAQTQPAPSVPDGWLRAIDEALVIANIGVADENDTYEQAKAKLDNLIKFHVDVAIDPAVNGGWKLVPRPPTPTMVKAGLESSHVLNVHRVLACYDAMIDAAPEAKS